MSSMLRRIVRKRQRVAGSFTPKEQPVRYLPDGGYETLRPTKGWLRVSGKRIRAGLR